MSLIGTNQNTIRAMLGPAQFIGLSNLKEVALFVIAVWGAALSTFNWWQARAKDARTVRITHSYKYEFDSAGIIGPSYLEITATNAGQRQVTIATLTLETPEKKWMANAFGLPLGIVDTKRPATLADGQTSSAHFPIQALRNALLQHGTMVKTKLTPFAKDTLGTTYRGKAIEIDPHGTD